MQAKPLIAAMTCSKRVAVRWRTGWAARLLPLLILMLPVAVQAQFDYTTNNGTITITGYTGSGGVVAIPSTINGLPVTRIGDEAFHLNYYLTDVTIPDSVTSIGDKTFEDCFSLTNVTIGNSVTNIGNSAFASCLHLTTIAIPDSVTRIGVEAFGSCRGLTNVTVGDSLTSIETYAFSGCTRLTSITIPNSVTGIGSNSFAQCTSLSSFTVDALNAFYSSVDGVLFDKNQTTLIQYPGGKSTGSYTIPASVTSIGNGAFQACRSLTNATIPDSVTTIGVEAFSYCTSLISVAIPNSVSGIGDLTFSHCTSLTNAAIPDSVTNIGELAFRSCTSLARVTIGNSVTTIGGSAFSYCTSLTSVTIPNSVTSIGWGAFSSCTSLTTITIPNSITNIGWGTFFACTGLSSITVDVLNAIYSSVDGVLFDKSQTRLIQYPGGKTGCYTIPNSITRIGDGAFYYSFYLTSVTIPNSVTTIGDKAFSGCASLTNVTIPDSVTSIGDGAFSLSERLTSVSIPNSVTRIGEEAFKYCTSLTNITIGSSVTSIGDETFRHCTSLTSVTIPNSVTHIGWGAFSKCTRLTGVYFQGNAPSADGDVFEDAYNVVVYYLPGTTGWGTTFAGRSTAVWPTSAPYNYTAANGTITLINYTGPGGEVAIPSTIGGLPVTLIGDSAFNGQSSLTSVTIPPSVTRIGNGAFSFCTSLTSATIPESVIRIGDHAFLDCTSLTGVYFEGNAPGVETGVFDGANNAIVYCLPGTTGWGTTFAGRPTTPWYPDRERLLVRTSGQGTLSPNYGNVLLKRGRTFNMTAAGTHGYAFSKWTVSTNWGEGVTVSTPKLAFVMQSNLTVEAIFVDVARPTVTIASPETGQRISNALATVRGRASDNAQLAQVLCQVNSSDWVTALGTSNWTVSLALTPGTNRVRAYAVDAVGHSSPTNTVTFVQVATSQLTLVTNGHGHISRSFTGHTLEVGRGYAVRAVPSSGQWFSNWTGTISAINNSLHFLMQSNMVLQANFVPNPYLELKGSYAGLFRPDSPESLGGTNAGSVALTLTEQGTFSGRLRLAGAALALTGRFDLGGQAMVRVPRPGKAPLWLNLGFASQTIVGQVSTEGWSSDLAALRRANASSNTFAGRYTMLVMGQHQATDAPPGDSPLAVLVSVPGSVTVSGRMADGSAVTLTTGHSTGGVWPFHASVHGGRGLVIGWLTCETNAALREVLWVKPPDSGARYYPGGFREDRAVALKRYLPAAPKQSPVSWSTGRLLIGGGNLPEPIEAEVLVTNNLIKRLSGSVSNLSLVITNSNGRFGGSFMHPVTHKPVSVRGVLVQGLPWVSSAEQVTVGGGWFLGTNETGYLWLEPKP